MRHARLMRSLAITACATAMTVFSATAQPAPGDPPQRGPRARPDAESLVTRMMAFDKNGDGQLTKDEVTDPRLSRLFERADANHDGVVTRDELTALVQREQNAQPQDGGPGGPPGQGGPGGGGPGGPGARGRQGGPGGGGGPGGMMGGRPGQVLPQPLRERLNLTPDQQKQLDELQKEVDAKLAKILTDDQRTQLEQMPRRGPGGPGGRGGPGGQGSPGGGQGGPGGPGGGPRPGGPPDGI